ncbi:MAG: alkyl hydroperoxide reductase subunit D [Myxococcota bacterium]|jgi:alkyl hydroperoxide reductase subunit D
MTKNIEFQDYAKDIKLNLSSVLKIDPESSLLANQIHAIALSCAYATKNSALVEFVLDKSQGTITEAEINAAKAAASIMAMNNIYYRFAHLVSDKEYLQIPAKLRMNIIGNPGVDKVDFELFSLAVSAINGCGLCIDSHVKTLTNAKIDKSTIAHSIRISSVINAVSQTLFIN